jgi:hypothetical protein
MEVSGQLHTPFALPQGKSPQYPLDTMLGGPYKTLFSLITSMEGRPIPRSEDNIEINLQYIGCNTVEWIQVTIL